MSFAEFTSNKNKGVLWGLLQEGGVFDNIPASMFQNVKNIFETSILSMKREFNIFFDKNDEGDDDYDKKATEMIINSNKSVIKKVIDEVNRIKMHNENITKQSRQIRVAQAQTQAQQNSLPLHLKPITLAPTPTPIPASIKKPKIEEIYRADDIKKTRMSELEIRLKEKQAEMDNMLNNKKPEHIDFSDKALGKNRESDLYDKKLAGDEMERLLAETLASRERELEKLNINVGSFSKGVSGGAEIPVNKIVTKRLRESKNVTFNDEDNTHMEYEKQEKEQEQENENGNQEDENNNTNEENELSFFSKLKLKTGNSTPLDDIMNNANRSDDEDEDEDDEEEKEIMQLRVQEIGNFSGIRETREAGEMQQMQQMREMQRYIILEQRIKVIHDDLNEIKKNQGLILSLLEKKMQ
jgi:hypothetical protein